MKRTFTVLVTALFVLLFGWVGQTQNATFFLEIPDHIITDQELRECSQTLPVRDFDEGVLICPEKGFQPISDKRIGGMLRFSHGKPTTVNSFASQDSYTALFIEPLYRGLGDVAESVSITQHPATVTVKIRPGIRLTYPDGRTLPFNADVVLFTAQTAFTPHPDNPSKPFFTAGGLYAGHSSTGDIQGFPQIEKLDELTVRFTFPNYFMRMMPENIIDLLLSPKDYTKGGPYSCGPLHPDAVGLSAEYPNKALREIVELAIEQRRPELFENALGLDTEPASIPSCGPFMLEQLDPERGATFVRNPNYFMMDENGRSLPLLEGIEIDFVEASFAGAEASLQRFLSGQTDLFYGVRNEQFPLLEQMRASSDISFHIPTDPTTTSQEFFVFNQDIALGTDMQDEMPFLMLRTVFRNPVFRRAMSKLVDRSTMVREAHAGLAFPRFGPGSRRRESIQLDDCPSAALEPTTQILCERFASEVAEALSYAPLQAAADLDSIGIVDRNGDGIRDVPPFFGQIVPGANGRMESELRGDDFVNPVPENPVIVPGPNGVLETLAAGDDVAVVTPLGGALALTAATTAGNTEHETKLMIWANSLADVNIDVEIQNATFFMLATWLLNDPGSLHWQVILIGLSESEPNVDLQRVYSSCGSNDVLASFWKRSNCAARTGQPVVYRDGVVIVTEDDREPFQHRLDELVIQGIPNDPLTGRDIPPLQMAIEAADLARISAEVQFLLGQGLPYGPYTFAGLRYKPLVYRTDRVENTGYYWPNHSMLLAEIIYRVDI